MQVEDIPAWVPEAVRRMAAVYGTGHEMVTRFLSDPAMEAVWSYLRTRPVQPDFRSRLRHQVNLDDYEVNLDDYASSNLQTKTETDQAFANLFYSVLVAANNTRTPVYATTINKVVRELSGTIKRVQALRHFAPAPALPIGQDVLTSIDVIAAYCRDRIIFLDVKDNPSVLKARGRPPAGDPTRACVREIGTATYALYGECFYGQLATIANIMFRPKEAVTDKSAENWCTRPDLPIRQKHKGDPSH